MTQKTVSTKALKASRVGVFAALYAATSLIPISVFIGAPSFLAVNLVITPVIAILLSPTEALFSSLFGSIIAFYIAPMQAMFGPYTILLPVVGATFGSLAFHRRRLGALVSALYLAISISAYLVRNYSFPYFIAPHSLAIFLAIASSFKSMKIAQVKIPMYAYVSTMCEQGMMMIFAVNLLGLPWFVFPGILPLMIYERIVGTMGAALIVIGLTRLAPTSFEVPYTMSGVRK